MRSIKNPETFVGILRALETVIIFALMGLVIYSLIAGLKVEEVREHYRESHENEKRILELLEGQQKTQEAVERVEEEVKP